MMVDSQVQSVESSSSSVASSSPTSAGVEQRVLHTLLLCQGASFLKYGRTGKPHVDVVKMSVDGTKLYWGKKFVSVTDLQQVTAGRTSAVFRKYDADNHAATNASEMEALARLSFSLQFATRTLDLQVEYASKKADPEKLERDLSLRNAWVAAARWLIDVRQSTPTATLVPLPTQQTTPDRSTSSSTSHSPALPSVNSFLPTGAAIMPGSGRSSPFFQAAAAPAPPAHTSNVQVAPAPVSSVASVAVAPSAHPHSHGADSSIGLPHNVIRTTHVNKDFQWERERLDADFTLVRKLGAGAFAEVWLARHRLLGFEVAVKTIQLSSDPMRAAKEKEEIKDEIAILKLCRNKYIVGFLGCCPTPDGLNRMWVLMDHFRLGSILNLTQKSGQRLTEGEIAFVIHSVLMGLIYLNSRNVVHKDVKARNILVSEKGECALADFGVSKILHTGRTGGAESAADTPHQVATTIAGSPCFMAPECCAGHSPDFKADVWSVGIVCIELANNGRVPHDDLPTPFRIMRAVRTSAPPTLHWTPCGDVADGGSASPTDGTLSTAPPTSGGPTPAWSGHFVDFVSRCLEVDPHVRADAVSLLSHPFVSGAFSPASMSGQLRAYEEAERKRAKHARKAAAGASSAGAKGKPSVLESLFKLLGRKGPTNATVKSQVDALRQKGRLDEMGDPEDQDDLDPYVDSEPPSGEGTVVINGSDTTILNLDDLDDDESARQQQQQQAEEMQVVVVQQQDQTPDQEAAPTGSDACPEIGGDRIDQDVAAILSESIPPSVNATPAASPAPSPMPTDADLTPIGPTHTSRRSLQSDFLLRCTSSQLAALAAESGLDNKAFGVFLQKVTSKYGTIITTATTTKAKLMNTPAARKQQGAAAAAGATATSGAAVGATLTSHASTASADDDDDDDPTPLSLFPGCTPSGDVEEYVAQLEYSTVMVCGLSRNDLTSLKRMTNAPPPVRMAIESVALVLGVKPMTVASRKPAGKGKPTHDYWSTAQAVLVRPNFLTLLKTYDFTRHLNPDIIDRLHEFSSEQPAAYTPEVVSSSSTTAGILWNWTRSIYNYAIHCIGYRPDAWTEHDEPNALTVKDGDAKIAATIISPPMPKTARRLSHNFDASQAAQVLATSNAAVEMKKPIARRRSSFGSFGHSAAAAAVAAPPMHSPASAPANGVAGGRIRRVSSGVIMNVRASPTSLPGSTVVSQPPSGRVSPVTVGENANKTAAQAGHTHTTTTTIADTDAVVAASASNATTESGPAVDGSTPAAKDDVAAAENQAEEPAAKSDAVAVTSSTPTPPPVTAATATAVPTARPSRTTPTSPVSPASPPTKKPLVSKSADSLPQRKAITAGTATPRKTITAATPRKTATATTASFATSTPPPGVRKVVSTPARPASAAASTTTAATPAAASTTTSTATAKPLARKSLGAPSPAVSGSATARPPVSKRASLPPMHRPASAAAADKTKAARATQTTQVKSTKTPQTAETPSDK